MTLDRDQEQEIRICPRHGEDAGKAEPCTVGQTLASPLRKRGRFAAVETSGPGHPEFSAQLQTLLEVQNALSKAPGLDELCRTAASLAVSRLGFERIGIWFVFLSKIESLPGHLQEGYAHPVLGYRSGFIRAYHRY